MIEKIINLLASVPNDKLLHSYLVLILSLICYDILELFLPMWWNNLFENFPKSNDIYYYYDT